MSAAASANPRARARGEDEPLVQHRLGILRHVVEAVEEDRERGGEEKRRHRRRAAAAARLAELARLGGSAGTHAGLNIGDADV
jgi:hypothetical protein